MRKLRVIVQYLAYVAASRRWWVLPIMLALLVLGAILLVAQGSPLAPFVYTLF